MKAQGPYVPDFMISNSGFTFVNTTLGTIEMLLLPVLRKRVWGRGESILNKHIPNLQNLEFYEGAHIIKPLILQYA